MSTGTSSVYSQAFNFGTSRENGVDPRTGLYTYSVDLYETPSHARNLPSFKLSLDYNPLNTVDSGLGTGWSFSLPSYDPGTKNLVLSTGESFKAAETNGQFIVGDQKLKSFRAAQVGSEYHVVYKTGQTEVLSNSNGVYNRSVPITVYASNGRSIALTWTLSGSKPRLSKIQDGDEILVDVQYGDSQVRVIQEPGTSHESVFTLVQKNGQLVQAQSPEENMSPWEFSYEEVDSRFLCLTRLTTPTGLVENVTYKPDGHRLPSGAPYPTIPYVTTHVVEPGREQPAITTSYTYSAKNFLGYDSGRDWTPDGDNLYQAPAGYQYTSTVQVKGGSTTVNEYDKFHLLVGVERHQGVKKTTHAITYHANPNTDFDGQPPQCQLPRSVEITYSDTKSGEQRKETTNTIFDEWGNLTEETRPSQVTIKRTYYPPEGEPSDCPADPHGFQRYLKEETVVPADTEYDAPVRRKHYIYHELPTATGALVGTFVVAQKRFTLDGFHALNTAELNYVSAPTSRDHGRIQQEKTWLQRDAPATLTYDYAYPENNELKETLTTTTFDGVTVHDINVYSLSSGLIVSQIDDAEVRDTLEYDKLGRLTKAATAVGTMHEASSQTVYSVSQEGHGLLVTTTGSNGVQTQTITDGLGRLYQVRKQDGNASLPIASMYNANFRVVLEQKYNQVGQCIEKVEVDWLRQKGGDAVVEQRNRQKIEYDDWGQVSKITNDAGVATVTLTDPIALTRSEGIAGQALTKTHLGLNGVPTRVELLRQDGSQYSQIDYRYDGLGRLVEEEDALHHITKYQFDSFDRVAKTTGPGGRVIEVQYATESAAALPASVRVGRATIGSQRFDGLDRATQIAVGGRPTTQGYKGSAQQPAEITTPKGDLFSFAYEPALDSALVAVTGIDINRSYTYDSRTGAARQMKDTFSTRDLGYFPSGLIQYEAIEIDGKETFTTQSTYSLAGKLQLYTDVHGQEHENGYDSTGRLRSITVGDMNVSISYDTSNRVSVTTVRNSKYDANIATNRAYDEFGREVERIVSNEQGTLYKLSQTYGLTGLLATRRLEDGDGVILRDEGFGNDANNRLVQYTCTGSRSPYDENGNQLGSQKFVFGEYDNLESVETVFQDRTNNTSTYLHGDDQTQIIRITNTDSLRREISLAYDQNGCLTQDEQGRYLEYDTASRLTAVQDTSGKVISEYRYDAAGRLICQIVPGKPDENTYFFYRQDKLIATKTGDRLVSYITDGEAYWGHIVQEAGKTQTQLWTADGHESILGWRDPEQAEKIHFQEYTPYGYSTGASSIGFNGEWKDPVTGWYHLGNGYRVYNPVLMRFHTPDPRTPFTSGEVNPYAYCLGNPINRGLPSRHPSFLKELGKALGRDTFIAPGVDNGSAVDVLTGGASLAGQVASRNAVRVASSEDMWAAEQSGMGNGVLELFKKKQKTYHALRSSIRTQ